MKSSAAALLFSSALTGLGISLDSRSIWVRVATFKEANNITPKVLGPRVERGHEHGQIIQYLILDS